MVDPQPRPRQSVHPALAVLLLLRCIHAAGGSEDQGRKDSHQRLREWRLERESLLNRDSNRDPIEQPAPADSSPHVERLRQWRRLNRPFLLDAQDRGVKDEGSTALAGVEMPPVHMSVTSSSFRWAVLRGTAQRQEHVVLRLSVRAAWSGDVGIRGCRDFDFAVMLSGHDLEQMPGFVATGGDVRHSACAFCGEKTSPSALELECDWKVRLEVGDGRLTHDLDAIGRWLDIRIEPAARRLRTAHMMCAVWTRAVCDGVLAVDQNNSREDMACYDAHIPRNALQDVGVRTAGDASHRSPVDGPEASGLRAWPTPQPAPSLARVEPEPGSVLLPRSFVIAADVLWAAKGHWWSIVVDDEEVAWQRVGEGGGGTRLLMQMARLPLGEHVLGVCVGMWTGEEPGEGTRRPIVCRETVVVIAFPAPLDHHCQEACAACADLWGQGTGARGPQEHHEMQGRESTRLEPDDMGKIAKTLDAGRGPAHSDPHDIFQQCLDNIPDAFFSGETGVNEEFLTSRQGNRRLEDLDAAFGVRRGCDSESREPSADAETCRKRAQGHGLIILDIGANVGQDTMLLAHRYPLASIYSFEPEQALAESLNKSLASRGLLMPPRQQESGACHDLSGVQVRAVALGPETKTATFSSQSSAGGFEPGGRVVRFQWRHGGGGADVDVHNLVQQHSIADQVRGILQEHNQTLQSLHECKGSGGGGSVRRADQDDDARLVVLMNCEGCEYGVVEGLAVAGMLPRVLSLTMGTHLLPQADLGAAGHVYDETFVPFRYCLMHFLLARSHTLSWGGPWTWERWMLTEPAHRQEQEQAAASAGQTEAAAVPTCVRKCAECARAH